MTNSGDPIALGERLWVALWLFVPTLVVVGLAAKFLGFGLTPLTVLIAGAAGLIAACIGFLRPRRFAALVDMMGVFNAGL